MQHLKSTKTGGKGCNTGEVFLPFGVERRDIHSSMFYLLKNRFMSWKRFSSLRWTKRGNIVFVEHLQTLITAFMNKLLCPVHLYTVLPVHGTPAVQQSSWIGTLAHVTQREEPHTIICICFSVKHWTSYRSHMLRVESSRTRRPVSRQSTPHTVLHHSHR